jgi:SAM-dependent methyltransferase
VTDAPQDFWLRELSEAKCFNEWVLDSIGPLPGASVLEIGCGTGSFTSLLAARGHRVVALDLNPDYVEIAQRRTAHLDEVDIRCADVTEISWEPRFDAVLLLDVLEHIENDVEVLLRLRNALKPNGVLVLKVPAGQWLYGSMDRAIGHYRRYSRQTLRHACLAAGFNEPAQKLFNVLGVLGWWVNGRLLKRTTPPGAQVTLFERLVPVARVVDRLMPLPIALSLIAVASVPCRP